MARIRTIKPEFFTSESILELEPLARLFFISLWCEADREGRLAWKPKTLKYRYLPADDADIDKIAESLIANDLIEIYTVDGKEYCQVCNFQNHQVVNNREKDSVLPKPSDACVTRESRVKAEGRKEGKGKEGREGEERDAKASPIPYKAIAELYNELCTNLPKIAEPDNLNDKRKRAIKKFWNHNKNRFEKYEAKSDLFAEYFTLANQDDFLCGRKNNADHSSWIANLEYLMRVDKYDDFMRL